MHSCQLQNIINELICLQHQTNVFLDLFSLIAILLSLSVLLVELFFLEFTSWGCEAERPEKRRSLAKVIPDGINFVHQIFHTDHAGIISQSLFNDGIVRKRHTLPVYLAMSTLSNEIIHEGLARRTISHEGLYEMEHLGIGSVVPDEHTLVRVAQPKMTKGTTDLAGHASAITDTDGKNNRIGTYAVGGDLYSFGLLGKGEGCGFVLGIVRHDGHLLRLGLLGRRRTFLHPLPEDAVVSDLVIALRSATRHKLLWLDHLGNLGLGGEYLAIATRIGQGLSCPMSLHLVHIVSLLEDRLGDQREAPPAIFIAGGHG